MKSFILYSIFASIAATPIDTFSRSVQDSPCDFSPSYNVSQDDIKIYFRSQKQVDTLIDWTNIDFINSLGFSSSKDTAFLVHGWQNEYDSPFNDVVSLAMLKNNDVNIFIVDWSVIAYGVYTVAYQAVPDIAKVIGALINTLATSNNLDLDKTFIVGHSLGAHVAGLIGHDLNGKLSHIIGLDPALPCFSYDDLDDRLDSSDAKFVQVIHTCPGLLGFDVEIGSADYWPNGDKNQPGCMADVVGSCAHGRSYIYYAESLETGGFIAEKCESYKDYEKGTCNGVKSYMGEYKIDKTAKGSFYLDTNSKSPYAKH